MFSEHPFSWPMFFAIFAGAWVFAYLAWAEGRRVLLKLKKECLRSGKSFFRTSLSLGGGASLVGAALSAGQPALFTLTAGLVAVFVGARAGTWWLSENRRLQELRSDLVFLRALQGLVASGFTVTSALSRLSSRGLVGSSRRALKAMGREFRQGQPFSAPGHQRVCFADLIALLLWLESQGHSIGAVLEASLGRWAREETHQAQWVNVRAGLMAQAGFCAGMPWILSGAGQFFLGAEATRPPAVLALACLIWEIGGTACLFHFCRFR